LKAVSRDEEALLQAVVAEPDSDVPRLVYADWLEEHGDEPRAAFIRVQCALADLGRAARRRPGKVLTGPFLDFAWLARVGASAEPRRRELEEREKELLLSHGEAWVAPFRGLALAGLFERGFLVDVDVTVPTFWEHGGTLLARLPLELVTFVGGEVEVAELIDCPHLEGLRGLSLWGDELSDDGLATLASCTRLTRLRELYLSTNDFTAEGVLALTGAPFLSALGYLSLQDNIIADEGLRLLAGCDFPELRTLELAENEIGDEGVRALAASPRLPQLTSLGLVSNPISDAGFQALAESPYLANLADLHLGAGQARRNGEGYRALVRRFGDALR
jgi:uncharacterized protein (TIGR02996 family)